MNNDTVDTVFWFEGMTEAEATDAAESVMKVIDALCDLVEVDEEYDFEGCEEE